MPTPRRLALLLAAAGVLAGCGSPTVVEAGPADGMPPQTAAPTAAPPGSPALPDGWRWESYRNVQVAVPGDWSWIGGSQRTSQWCIGEGEKVTGVGRPGFATTAGCFAADSDGVSPGERISTNGTFVAFGQAEFDKPGTLGDRTTVAVGDVSVSAQAEPALRESILATVHQIAVDASGCPVRDEVTATPSLVPAPAIALAELSGVRSVAVCRYDLDEGKREVEGPSLSSSVRLTGETAAGALAALADAPAAGGQDRPEGCLYKYGGEMVVLLVESAAGPSRVHVRYSGCDHNGVDDGISPRRLTPALLPFFSGPNRPNGLSGGDGKSEAVVGVRNGRVPPPTPPPA